MNAVVAESSLRIVIRRRNLRSPTGPWSRALARLLLQQIRAMRHDRASACPCQPAARGL